MIQAGVNFVRKINVKPILERGLDLDQIAKDYVYMLNKIVAAKPADLAITMHICLVISVQLGSPLVV